MHAPELALGRAVELLVWAVQTTRRCHYDQHPTTPPLENDAESQTAEWLAERAKSWPTIDAHWLGIAYQRALDHAATGDTNDGAKRRRTGGIFYTPRSLVAHLIGRTLDTPRDIRADLPITLDPACGCGAFLVEAARRIQTLYPDASPREIANAIHGIDIDPLAASLCRLALWLELGQPDDPLQMFGEQIRVADTLLAPPPRDTFDLVLGNPPFLSQLAATTARSPAATDLLRERFGDSLRPYTDPAALFLQLGVESLRAGGRLGMVLPVSVLASRDAAEVRARVSQLATIRSLWLDTEGIFDAGVRTVALTFTRGDKPEPILRYTGSSFSDASPFEAATPDPASWGPLAADLTGVPAVRTRSTPTLGDRCEITAGFRDEYYAIARVVQEQAATDDRTARPIATVGSIDPATIGWGERAVKIAGQSWLRPCAAPNPDDPVLTSAFSRQSRPKLLVATQSKVIEAAADPDGRFLALTPVIMLYPLDPQDPDAIWRLGAVLSSPVLSAWAAAHSFGTARSLHAIKPSAALLRDAPLPTDDNAWSEAADHYRAACGHTEPAPRAASLLLAARASCRAYEVGIPAATTLLDWWLSRLPKPRHPAPT